jgi:hypothetical protein
MEAATAGPEELHRAIPMLGESRLGIIAVCEPSIDILGEKDAGADLGESQQRQHHQESRSNEPFHQN